MMNEFKRVLFAAVAAIGFVASAAVVRYDSAATGAGDGSSWADAYTDIAAAIAAVANAGGGEVWVKEGAHPVAKDGFALASGVSVLGGFDGGDYADEATERAARDPKTHESIFDGAGNGAYIIKQNVACGNTAVVDGLVFTDAQYVVYLVVEYATPIAQNCVFRGPICGLVTDKGSSIMNFTGCVFEGIASNGRGYGAINFGYAGPDHLYTDCVFRNCIAQGYGICQCSNRRSLFTRCSFIGNTGIWNSNGGGRAISASAGTYDYVDCDFIGNAVTNAGSIVKARFIENCRFCSNEVVYTSAPAGISSLIDLESAIYGSTFYDNKVLRSNTALTVGSSVAALVRDAHYTPVIINSTLWRNTCQAEVAPKSDATAYGCTLYWAENHWGSIVGSTLLDNDVLTSDILWTGGNPNYAGLVANSIFENAAADYTPISSYSATGLGLTVDSSSLRNFDPEKFNLKEAKNVTDDPVLYLPKFSGKTLYVPLRSGTPECGPGLDMWVDKPNHGAKVDGYGTMWMNVKSISSSAPLMPDILGKERESGTFVYGSAQITNAEDEVAIFRAKVTPVGSGTILGVAKQDIPAGEGISAITAVAASDEIAFLGWRDVGEEACFETAVTLNLASVPKDRTVEAVFGTPKVPCTFDLGAAGTFDDNGLSVIVIEYDIGDKPEIPKWTQNPAYHVIGWDVDLPAFVTKDPFVMTLRSVEMAHRIRRYDSTAPDGGDGLTWATAMNSLEQALSEAGQWTGEVWIKEGLHTIKETDGVSLRKNVAVRGGFAGVDSAYADNDAERAARDPASRYTALQGSGDKIFNQKVEVDQSGIVDGIAITNTQYAYYANAAKTHPVFTNCVFAGKAGFYGNQSLSGVDVYDSRISNLSGGNNWGPIHIQGGDQQCIFRRCVIEGSVNSSYGVFNFPSGGSSGRFEQCVFRNLGSANYPICYGTEYFYDCEFFNNQKTAAGDGALIVATEMARCRVISNRVVRTDSSAGGLTSLIRLATSGRMYETTVFGNEVIRNQPGITSGTPTVALIAGGGFNGQVVNSTVAKNKCRAYVGEGATPCGATVYMADRDLVETLNSTFIDNDVETSEFADCDRDSTYGVVASIVNVVCRNEKAGYTPIVTLSGTYQGFAVYSSILPGFDESRFNRRNGKPGSVITAQPSLSRGKWIDGQLVYPLRKMSELKGFAVDAYTGPNGYYDVDTNRAEWHCGDKASNPKVLIGDIVGNERPSGQFTPGSYQPFAPSGLVIFFQ